MEGTLGDVLSQSIHKKNIQKQVIAGVISRSVSQRLLTTHPSITQDNDSLTIHYPGRSIVVKTLDPHLKRVIYLGQYERLHLAQKTVSAMFGDHILPSKIVRK